MKKISVTTLLALLVAAPVFPEVVFEDGFDLDGDLSRWTPRNAEAVKGAAVEDGEHDDVGSLSGLYRYSWRLENSPTLNTVAVSGGVKTGIRQVVAALVEDRLGSYPWETNPDYESIDDEEADFLSQIYKPVQTFEKPIL